MEKKEIASTGKITAELIGGLYLYGIIIAFLYELAVYFVSQAIPSDSFLQAIFIVIAQGICVFFAWRGSIKSTFKKRTIEISKLPQIMRNLIICTVIMWLLGTAVNFSGIDRKIREKINSDSQTQYQEYLMQYLYSEEKLNNYYQEKEKAISKEKSKIQRQVFAIQIALLGSYFVALFAQRENIANYCILDLQSKSNT